jgi:RIO kinase 1
VSFFDESAASLRFSTFEPGPDQRWSTWPSTTPTERGPRPHPDWLVVSAAAFDTELGVVKTGKEADLFLLERAVPGDPSATCLLAAKRYRAPDRSDFHRSAAYQEGRRMRNTRDTRAVERKSAHGRAVSAVRWAGAEFEALCAMWSLGVPVPYPVQIAGTEILMEFIGQDGVAAPRLAEARPSPAEAGEWFRQVAEILHGFARAGFAHGDLSPYNLLLHRERVIVIDLPQLVDIAANPNGATLLQRDCHNVCDWFRRRGVVADEDELFADLIGEAFGAAGW